MGGGRIFTPNMAGKIVADQTYNASWIAGTATVDPATDIFTLAGHGLTNNDPIEFDVGTGALPAGISAYNVDTIGGEYYNVINVSGDTFQITATPGGSTPVDVTSTGTAGWKIRKAFISTINASGLILDSHLEYDILVLARMVKFTATAQTLLSRLNASSTFKYFSGATWGDSFLTVSPQITQKYSLAYIHMNIRKIASDRIMIRGSFNGQESANKTTATNLALNFGSMVIPDASVTSVRFISASNTVIQYRSGTRILAVRR
jgi:hypothetical protein